MRQREKRHGLVCIAFVALAVMAPMVWAVDAEPVDAPPLRDAASWPLSGQAYAVRFLPAAVIRVDGRRDEPAWEKADVERGFCFPWRHEEAPATEFRAVCTDHHLAFMFRAHDDDIVVLDALREEEDVILEDRVEMLFAVDDRLGRYGCIEIDSRGRVFDYAGAYYRRFDPSWRFVGAEIAALPLDGGYLVEGRIPLESLEKLGLPRLKPGVQVRCGLYRAEFSHDTSGGPAKPPADLLHTHGRSVDGPVPIQDWISWIDPGTSQPDFHVPSSLGLLEIVD